MLRVRLPYGRVGEGRPGVRVSEMRRKNPLPVFGGLRIVPWRLLPVALCGGPARLRGGGGGGGAAREATAGRLLRFRSAAPSTWPCCVAAERRPSVPPWPGVAAGFRGVGGRALGPCGDFLLAMLGWIAGPVAGG